MIISLKLPLRIQSGIIIGNCCSRIAIAIIILYIEKIIFLDNYIAVIYNDFNLPINLFF